MGVGGVYQTRGQLTFATASYEQALAALGQSRPKGIWTWLGSLSMMCQIISLPASVLRKVHRRKTTRAALLEHRIFSNLFGYVFEQRDVAIIDYPYAGLRSCIAAIAEGTPVVRASGLGDVAILLAMNGLPWLGQRLLQRRDILGSATDDAEIKGRWTLQSAVVHANARNLAAADIEFLRSRPLLAKSGAHLWLKTSTHLHRHLKAIDSKSSEELEVAELVLQTANAASDIQAQFMGHYDIAGALAQRGEIGRAHAHLQTASEYVPNGELNLTEAIFLGTVGFVRIQSSDYEGARAALEKSWRLTLQRKLAIEYVVRSLPYLIESIVGPRWLSTPNAPGRPNLPRLCRLAMIAYYLYPNMRSPIERVRGRAFWLLGKRRRAVRTLERAVKLARNLEINYDLAKSLLDLAAVQEEGRDKNRQEAIELLKKMESVVPRAESWLLGDQFDEAVVAPEFNLEAWQREHGSPSAPARDD